MEYQTSLHRAPDPADAAAVAACAEAIEEEPRDIDPVSATLAIHRRLFAGARAPIAETAGRLKLRANGTADPDAPGGFFYYTQPASVAAALEDWCAFTLTSDLRTSEIVREVLSHWVFETSIRWPTATAASAGSWCPDAAPEGRDACGLRLLRRSGARGEVPLCRGAPRGARNPRHGPVGAPDALLPRPHRRREPLAPRPLAAVDAEWRASPRASAPTARCTSSCPSR